MDDEEPVPRNEVIADSEDELDNFKPDGDDSYRFPGPKTGSNISAFTMTNAARPKLVSSISEFTNGIMTECREDIDRDLDRATGSSLPGFSTFAAGLDGFPGVSSIADRAKTRQRHGKQSIAEDGDGEFQQPAKQKTKQISSDVIDITSSEDDFDPRLSASKPKPKPKPKPKAKPKDKNKESKSSEPPLEPVHPVTNPSSESNPTKKPRPRPRPIVKRPQPEEPPLPSTGSSAAKDIPIATSSPRPPSSLHSAGLPPSDPPVTSSLQGYIPPIETLPNPMASLFSDDENQGYSPQKSRGSDQGVGKFDLNALLDQVSPRRLPPPPTFFASSSSSHHGTEAGAPESRSDLQKEVLDLTDLPPTSEPSIIVVKKSAKPKKSKRKLTDISLLDEEDNDEDDFDPSTSISKGKRKEKAKVKKPKAKGNKAAEDQPRVEVTIVTKPRATPKGKQKQKPPEDQTFKSREFIVDSDEDDPLRLLPANPPPPLFDDEMDAIGSLSKTAVQPRAGRATGALSSSPNPRLTHSERTDPSSTGINTSDMPANPQKAKAKGKKRKSIVDSDAEQFSDAGSAFGEDQEIGTKKKKKPRVKETPKGKSSEMQSDGAGDRTLATAELDSINHSRKKSRSKKAVIQSDDDEVDEERLVDEASVRKQAKPSGSVRISSRVTANRIIQDDEDHEMDVDVAEPNAEEAKGAIKENIGPIPAASTKRSPPASTSADLPKGSHTPLYKRYEVAPRRSSLPMSELIRRATSTPNSPFPTPKPRVASSTSSNAAGGSTPKVVTPRAYSPYLKSSRNFLSRIAPLHPNRRTPPPPPPPPPPKKKTKKEIEMEEQWEEELIESVGGTSEWVSLPDDEKKALRKVKWAKEMGDWDD